VSLSPSRFAARFAVAFGESCMTYVTKWRLNVARSLLQETDYSVDEIAHRVGYQNLPAFIRVFKRYLGTSPASWRKQQ
jgi:AraC-like DNA-binding protein